MKDVIVIIENGEIIEVMASSGIEVNIIDRDRLIKEDQMTYDQILDYERKCILAMRDWSVHVKNQIKYFQGAAK